MPYSLLKHLDFNAWANGRLANVVESAPEAVLYAEMKSSFPTLEKTLLHMWDAEQIWLNRLKGSGVSGFPSAGFRDGKPELLAGFRRSAIELRDFVAAQPMEFMGKPVEYHNKKGDTFQNTPEEILFHVVNHGSFHRGQVVTMLREQGITALGSTDLITFLRI